MLDELKEFCKKIKAYEKKKAEHKEKISEIEEIIKPYNLQMQKEYEQIKHIREAETKIEEEAFKKDLLTCNLRDLISNICKLSNLSISDISAYIIIAKKYSKENVDDFLREIKTHPESGFLKLTIRTRKDCIQDFIYVLDFDIRPELKFADGTSIYDNIISKTNKQGQTELSINPKNAHNLILSFQPYQVAKQKPWTPLRKDEMLYQAVIKSSIKHWSKLASKTQDKIKE